MFLVVGLGNPGPEYAATRHNLGFKVIEELAIRLGLKALQKKHHSLMGEADLSGHKITLAQPQTFMNNSGAAAASLLNWYKLDPRQMIVIYDDVNLAIGQIRIREKGAAGGHHGVESIISSVGGSNFIRIRIGIGRESLSGDVADYVLQKIPPTERDILAEAVLTAAEAVENIVNDGLALAMNKYNT